MKKIISIAVATLLSIAAFAQEECRSIYNAYSSNEGVQAVYVSSAMFNLVGNIPSIELKQNGVDLAPIISSLKGFYLLNFESSSSSLSSKMLKDVQTKVDKGGYEYLFSVKDSGQSVNIYSISEKSEIKSMIMTVVDNSETVFIGIDGSIAESDFKQLIAAALK